eukprot:gene30470-35481_t
MVEGKGKGKTGAPGGPAGGRGQDGRGDERFAAMHNDPRFSSFPKNKTKLEIDKRFAGMFKDPEFQAKTLVDKRGRKVAATKKSDELRSFYRLKDEDEFRKEKNDDEEEEAEAEGKVKVPKSKEPEAKEKGQKQKGEKKGKKAEGEKESTGVDGSGGEKKKKKGKKGKEAEQVVEEEEEEEEELKGEDAESEEEEEEEEEGGGIEDEARLRFMRARGMIGGSSSDDSDDEGGEGESDDSKLSKDSSESSEEAEEEEEELDESEWGAGAMAANPNEEIPTTEETRRIAIVDIDWEHVTAVDMYAVLNSFKPLDGQVKRVTVYPSDYGIERMAEEAELGPQRIFKPKAKKNKEGGGQESDEASDSETTSLHVYNECDGLEFERSACKFDLRFVADEQDFSERQIRDTANSIPSGYVAPDIFNMSLQHTDPKLTWDAEDDSRKKVLNRKMTQDEVKDADFAAYLGSEEEDDEDFGEGIRQEEDAETLRASLLLGGGVDADNTSKAGGKSWGADEDADDEGEEGESDDDDDDADNGLESLGEKMIAKKRLESLGEKMIAKKREEQERRGETVWDSYLRKKKERKKAKKALKKGRQVDSSSSGSEDFGEELIDHVPKKAGAAADLGDEGAFDDPFFKDADDDFHAFAAVDSEADSEQEDTAVDSEADSEQEDAGGKRGKGKGKDETDKVALSKAEAKQKALEDKMKQAELELLLMDDAALRDVSRGGGAAALRTATMGAEDGGAAGGDLGRKLTKKEKRELKKAERRAAYEGSDDEDIRAQAALAGTTAGVEGEAPAEGFEVNLEDPRFGDMFRSSDFALDPTDPRFAKNKDSEVLMKKISKKRAKVQQQLVKEAGEKPAKESAAVTTIVDKAQCVDADAATRQMEMKAMVNKMKRKAQQSEAAAAEELSKSGKKKKATTF